MSTNAELASSLGLPLDTSCNDLERIREARVCGLSDDTPWKEVKKEELRIQWTSALNLEEDADWFKIYRSLKTSTIPEIITSLKAAEWWTEQIDETCETGPKFHEDIDFMFKDLPMGDNKGFDTLEEKIIFMCKLVYVAARDLLHDKYPTTCFETEYQPDYRLGAAAELVGVEERSFPVKAGTYIYKDYVKTYLHRNSEIIFKLYNDNSIESPDIFKDARYLFKELYCDRIWDTVQPAQGKPKTLKKINNKE